MRENIPNIDGYLRTIKDDRILTCGPVLFEIKRGIRPPERKKILPLFDALIRLSVDEIIYDSAGDLDASLRKKGITIPPMDVIIAQISLNHNVALFSLDKHFSLIPGLKVFQPSTIPVDITHPHMVCDKRPCKTIGLCFRNQIIETI